MPWEAWATLVVILIMMLLLVRNWAGPDTTLFGGLILLITLGLFSDGRLPSPAEAITGFGSEGLITIAVLFVVAQGLRQTGAMTLLIQPLLGRPTTIRGAQLRLMFPAASLSAFMNNTPIVAMFMPVVTDWCKKTGLSPSKLFLPLSYAAILGGTCTLIGTSTNLVVYDMIQKAAQEPAVSSPAQSPPVSSASGPTGQQVAASGPAVGTRNHQQIMKRTADSMGMFTIALVGLPATVLGIAYILIASPKLLKDRKTPVADLEDARRYTIEMLVEPGSPIVGKTIEKAGLRHLPGAYLAEIERESERLVAVGPGQQIHAGDRLIFVGIVETMVDLQKIRGLVPATDQVFKLDEPRPNRQLVEAVVSDRCPMVGKTIRDGRFRTIYNAVVIAVHRGGEHLKQKIGDIVLRPGDTLLIESDPGFVRAQRNRRDFFLVSQVPDSQPLRHDRAWIALGLMVAMVLVVTFTPVTLLTGALLAGGLMILTRCLTMNEARSSLDLRVLLTIGAAFGIGRAMEQSQAANEIARTLINILDPYGPYALLAGIYLLAMVFNMVIGNIGSAVLVFPIAKAAVLAAGGLSFMPFAIAIMMAASASYATPISYPTNLMVYGAGGYRFSDYMRLGLPLNFLIMGVVLALAPVFWPFQLAAAG